MRAIFFIWGEIKMNNYETYFLKDSYPFQVGMRYVYFDSLADSSSEIGLKTLTEAKAFLNNGILQIKRSNNSEPTTKMDLALKYLLQAAQNERKKEEGLINKFFEQFPEKIPPNIKNIKDNYMKLIIEINTMIKNVEPFKKQLQQELARAEERKILMQNAEKALKNNLNINEHRNTKTQYYHSHKTQQASFKNDDQTGKTSTVLNSIFSNTNNISILTKIIIEQYGSRLFIMKKQLELNPGEMNSLLKTLIDKANEMFIITIGANHSKIKNNLSQYEDEVKNIILSEEFQNFIQSLETSTALKPALSSMAKQMGLDNDIKELENIDKQLEVIKNRLLISYKKQFPKEKNFDKWRKEIGADDETLRQMYLNSQNVSIQHYYVSEQLTLMEMISAGFKGILGGNKNPTNDYLAGKLFFTITQNEAINNQINKAQEQITIKRNSAFEQIQTTTDLQSYQTNIKILRNLRAKQEAIIQQTIQNVEKIDKNLDMLLNNVNIHGSIKGYISIGETARESKGLQGASFGANILDQLDIIHETMSGFITPEDMNWLLFAMLNAGTQAIGHEYKHSLEDYFSTMIGFLMFNDAQLMFEDAINQIGYNENGSNDIHLYTINGIYMPNSFVLQRTYEALMGINSDINSKLKPSSGGLKTTLNTYNGGPINSDHILKIEDWENTSNAAIKATKLDMHFLTGMLDILENINTAMGNI